MSLNWNVEKVAESVRIGKRYEGFGPDAKEGYDGLSYLTETMIWATMAVGIGNLTEAEAPEFYARVRLYEAYHGAFLREARKGLDGQPLLDENGNAVAWDDRLITEQDVRDHIGMSTNVSKETRASWLKRFGGFSLDDGVARYNRAVQEADKERQRLADLGHTEEEIALLLEHDKGEELHAFVAGDPEWACTECGDTEEGLMHNNTYRNVEPLLDLQDA